MSLGFEFVETKAFSKRLDGDTIQAIQGDLLLDPKRGDLIKGTGGARKARVAGRGKGKSGGYRYLYLYLEHKDRIHLLFAFSKGEQDNLSPDQKKQVRALVESIRKE